MIENKLIKLFIVLTFALTGTTVACDATGVVPVSRGNVAVLPSAPVSETDVGSETTSGGGCSIPTMTAKMNEIIHPQKGKVEQKETRSDSSSSSPATSGKCGDHCTWEFNENTKTLTISGEGDMDDLSLKKSSTMPWDEFTNSIESITIENGITSIVENAFTSCKKLTSVTLESDDAVNCFKAESFPLDQIKEVTLGNNISYFVESDTFKECKNLTAVTLNNRWAIINFRSLFLRDKITSVTLNNIDSIPRLTFQGCSSLCSIKIPDHINYIGMGAFQGCSSLQSIEIPDSVTEIGNGAFEGCSSLQSIDNILNHISSIGSTIGSSMFSGCKSLTSINIPSNITSIEDGAFYGCSSLTSIKIPDSVNFIGNDTFAYSGLTSIEIPNLVSSIGAGAFQGCYSLASIKIPDSVTSIGELAFHGCFALTSIKVPHSVKTIEKEAFRLCKALKSVTFGNNIASIEAGTFYGCNNLTSVTANNDYTVKRLSSLVCDDGYDKAYTQVQKVILGSNVTSIPSGAFVGCKNLTSVEIPSTVTSIGDQAFENCGSLSYVEYLGTSDPGKGPAVFAGCSLPNVTVTKNYVGDSFCGKPVAKRETYVELKIDGVKVDDIDTDALIDVICDTGISREAVSIKVQTDESNNVLNILVYVNDEQTAHTIVTRMDKEIEKCSGTTSEPTDSEA